MSKPSAEQLANVEYIIPFPYSSNVDLDESGSIEPRLSVLSRISLDSAVALWERVPGAQIVIPGETGYGTAYDNTTDLMVKRAEDLGVPKQALVGLHTVGAESAHLNNTNLQAAAVADFFGEREELGTVQAISVALKFHAHRVAHSLRHYGLDAPVEAAETILQREGMHVYDDYLPHIGKLGRAEPLLVALDYLQPSGGLVNWLTKQRGARLADLQLDDDGKINVHGGSTASKLRDTQEMAEILKP